MSAHVQYHPEVKDAIIEVLLKGARFVYWFNSHDKHKEIVIYIENCTVKADYFEFTQYDHEFLKFKLLKMYPKTSSIREIKFYIWDAISFVVTKYPQWQSATIRMPLSMRNKEKYSYITKMLLTPVFGSFHINKIEYK